MTTEAAEIFAKLIADEIKRFNAETDAIVAWQTEDDEETK